MDNKKMIELLEKGVFGEKKILFINLNLDEIFDREEIEIEEIKALKETIDNYSEGETSLFAIFRNRIIDELKQSDYCNYEIEEDEEDEDKEGFLEIIQDFISSKNLETYLGKSKDLELREMVESIYDYEDIKEVIQYLKQCYLRILKNEIFKEEFTGEIKKIGNSYITALLSENPRKELNKFLEKLDK